MRKPIDVGFSRDCQGGHLKDTILDETVAVFGLIRQTIVTFRYMPLHGTYTIGQDQVRLSIRKPVQVQRLRLEQDVLPHDHAFFEICIVTSGRVEHLSEHGSFDARPGFLAVVPPGGVHAFRQPQGLTAINLYYLSDWLLADVGAWWLEPALMRVFYGSYLFAGSKFRVPVEWRLSLGDLHIVLETLRLLESEQARPQPSLLYLRSSLIKLQFDILRTGAEVFPVEADVSGLVHRYELVHVVALIEDAVVHGRSLAMGTLAGAVALSADHLNRLFRQELGLSIRAYHQRRRVQRACTLLLDPRNALKEIADMLGFGDAAHFHRSFRQIMGMTPSAYRAKFVAVSPR